MSELEWVKAPRQIRSRQTLERLLDAAESLLRTRSFHQISVAEIARQGGSSVGAFYGRFRDKNALLSAMQQRYAEEGRATAAVALAPSAWVGTAIADVIAHLCAFVVEELRQNRGRHRAFLMAAYADPEFAARFGEVTADTIAAIADLLEARATEFRHPDPRAAADFLHRILYGILEQDALYHGAPTARVLDDAALAGELARACTRYLDVVS